jgi:F-type H+-transporting ATPase subunit b
VEALGINLGYLIVQILNFAIMFIILRKWVFGPIANLLERRRASIAEGLENARIAAEARENAEQDAEKILAEAQAKANQIIREATERAEEQGREVLAAADADAAKKREEAMTEAERDKERMLGDLRGQVAALSMAATQKLIGESLDQQQQHMLINEFFSGVKSGKVVVMEGAELTGASAEVTSALPLTDEEKESVKADILSKLGSQATVTYRVDPNILGGLVVRVGDKVVDGSVAGQLESLRQTLS